VPNEDLDELEDGGRVLTEHEELVAHRTLRLLELDFSIEQILRMKAERRGFEWHEAERLLANHTHEQVTWLLED
jgi:hypothetical protein